MSVCDIFGIFLGYIINAVVTYLVFDKIYLYISINLLVMCILNTIFIFYSLPEL